jgi:hypothetical protein
MQLLPFRFAEGLKRDSFNQSVYKKSEIHSVFEILIDGTQFD